MRIEACQVCARRIGVKLTYTTLYWANGGYTRTLSGFRLNRHNKSKGATCPGSGQYVSLKEKSAVVV